MSVMYSTVSTKGQVTIPAEIRQKYSLQPGRRIGFRAAGDDVSLVLPQPIDEVRATLQQSMRAKGTLGVTYESGDGWAAHVGENE